MQKNTVLGLKISYYRRLLGLTQAELATHIGVSDKAISKWETAKGLPDISLLEPLAGALGVSVAELLSGQPIVNKNVSGSIVILCSSSTSSALKRGSVIPQQLISALPIAWITFPQTGQT